MENKNGQGIFYGVIGVATLIVAIIGATFAYFSATGTNSDINGNIAAFSDLTVQVSDLTSTSDKLIPVNFMDNTTTTTWLTGNASQFSSAIAGATGKAPCIDSNGDHVCQIYSVTVTNGGTAAISVRGTLNLTAENGSNMRWALIDSQSATAPSGYAKAELPGAPGNLTVDETLTTHLSTAQSKTLAKTGETGSSITYYVVVWLEETGNSQVDAGDYSGVVTFNSRDAAGNESGVTATFR